MRKALVPLVFLVLLAATLGLLGLAERFRSDPAPGETRGGGSPREGDQGLQAPDLTPDPAPEKVTPALTRTESPEPRATSPSGTEPPPGVEAGPEEPVPEPSVRPAIKPNPRAPPPPKPGIRPGGGSRPPMGPTGLWERFPPLPPTGNASIRARVLDRDGVPIPGATVYVGPPDAAGNATVSFGDLRKIGETDAGGVATGRKLPEGGAAVAANFAGLLNGPRGLDARSAVTTVLRGGETAEIEVTLPVALAELGSIRGRVLDPEGRPVRAASVTAGHFRVLSAADGSFTIPHLPAGTSNVSASRSGHRPAIVPVEVRPRETATVQLRLEYRERGSLSLSGVVVGPEGEPVPGAMVYLIAGRGTVRSERADEHGAFRMESLPDRLSSASGRIQASKMGYRAGNLTFEDGLESGEVEIKMPMRLVKLLLRVVDASTGEPQTRCRLTARRAGEEHPTASFSKSSADGSYDAWLPPGSVEMVVVAPDHETLVVEVDIGPGGGEFAYQARLVAAGADSIEVVLTVTLSDETTGKSVERARVEILDAESGEGLATLSGERPAGKFVLPVPSGKRRIAVTASGYHDHEESIEIDPESEEVALEIRLRPR